MKKLISLLSLMILLSGGVVFAASTSNRNPIPEPTVTGIKLNSMRIGSTEDDPIRIFKLVRFTGAGANQASVASGDALVYDTNSADGVSVRYTTTSADGAFAGIAVTVIQSADPGSTTAADDIGHKNWGWIVIHGNATANVTAGGTNGNSAGDLFITSSDSGKITTITANDKTSGPGNIVLSKSGGFFFSAGDGTSTSVKVFVKAT